MQTKLHSKVSKYFQFLYTNSNRLRCDSYLPEIALINIVHFAIIFSEKSIAYYSSGPSNRGVRPVVCQSHQL